MAEARPFLSADLAAGSRPRRVAMVSLHTSPTACPGRRTNGGLNVFVRQVCGAFGRRGVATDVFTRHPGDDTPDLELFGPLSRVVYLRAGPPELDKYRLLDHVEEFADRVEDFVRDGGLDYDLLYSHYWLSGLAACSLSGRLRLPWAHSAHTLAVVKNRHLAPGAEPEPPGRLELEGEITRCADLLVVSTAAEGDDLRRAYRVPADRLAVVPPGVDAAAFRPMSREHARNVIGHSGHRLLVFAGRLEPLKGVDVIIRAMALLTAGGRHPEVRLLVLGEDSGAGRVSEQERLRGLARDLGLDDRVEFLGSVSHDRLGVYYSAADACLVPSYSESFGLVGLEAQACGTPVVGSDLPGLASVVRDGVTGFLVGAHDPAVYAERMARLLDQPGLVERLGGAARRRAEGCTWERTADMLLARFADLCAPVAQSGVQVGSRQE